MAEAAAAADVSRATAYRYFSTQAELLAEVTVGPLGAPPSSGALSEGTVQERVQAAVAGLLEASSANEAMFRTYLKLSLESWLRDDEAGKLEYPRRQGRRMEWLALALADADTLTVPVRNKLSFALSMFMSIEALIVGADIMGVDHDEIESMCQWATQALLQTALNDCEEKSQRGSKTKR